MSDPKANSNNADPRQQEIEARLAKLRAETSTVFTQREIEERLARLANRDPSFYSSTDPPIKIYQMISKQQRMTDDEKADGLMEQLLGEMSLDDQYAKGGAAVDADIARRLDLLRGGTGQEQIGSASRQAIDLDARPKGHRELIAQILSQPDDVMHVSDDDESQTGSDDELEWCTTCNEDGQLQCKDCDNDIYCRDCFR